MKIPKFNRWY